MLLTGLLWFLASSRGTWGFGGSAWDWLILAGRITRGPCGTFENFVQLFRWSKLGNVSYRGVGGVAERFGEGKVKFFQELGVVGRALFVFRELDWRGLGWWHWCVRNCLDGFKDCVGVRLVQCFVSSRCVVAGR